MKFKRIAHQIVFALLAAILVLVGGIGFLLPFGVWPEIAAGFSDESLHIAQEASSAAIALGFLSGWCVFNYENCRPMHLVLMVFFLLMSLLHWVEYYHGNVPVVSGLVNTIPFAILTILLFLRQKDSHVAD